MKNQKQGSGVVYSTDHGRMCPQCDQPISACRCASEGKSPPPGDGVARIRFESKGRNGKAVTTVSGLQLTKESLEKLAKDLKKRLGTGGTVKDFTIEIQGDQRDQIEAELTKAGIKYKRAGG